MTKKKNEQTLNKPNQSKPQKPKQLPFSVIAQENSIYEEFVEFPVFVNDTEYIIKLYPYFSNTKISSLIQELIEFIKNSQEEQLDFDADAEFSDLIAYFMMRTFTDIKFTSSKKAKAIIQEYEQAKNSDLFKVIISSIPEESITKVYDAIYEIQEVNAKLMNQVKRMQEEYLKLPLENRDIIEGALKVNAENKHLQ